MRLTTTLVLLVMALSLGAVYLLLGSRGPSEGLPPTREPLLPSARWEQVTMRVGQQPATVLRRMADTGWELTEPVWWPADPAQVQTLMDTAAALKVREALDQPGEEALKAMSLSPPAGEVRLIGDQGVFTLYLGDLTQAGSGFVKTDAGMYAIIDAGLHDLAYLTPPTAWRAPTLPLPTAERLSYIEVRLNPRVAPVRPGFNPFILSRDEQRWSLGLGTGQRADVEQIVSHVMRLAQQQPAWVPDANTNHQLMLRPGDAQAIVTFVATTGRHYRLSIGRSADLGGERVFARLDASSRPDPQGEDDWRQGPILTLPRDVLTPWTRALDDWRDRRIIDTPLPRITSVRLLRGDQSLGQVTQEPAGTVGDGVFEAEPADKLAALAALDASDFDTGFTSSDPPALTIAVQAGLNERYTVDVFRFAEDAVFLRRGERVGYRRSVSMLPDWLRPLIVPPQP